MANVVANIAKGRVGEYFARVDNNDPSTSALIVVVLRTSGLASDDALRGYDTLADVLAASPEVANSGYARKTLTDTNITLGAPDDANDRYDYDIDDQTWTTVAAGDGWSKIVICYDGNTGSGTDANIVPLTFHDFVVVPDGSDITAVVDTAGFFRAS